MRLMMNGGWDISVVSQQLSTESCVEVGKDFTSKRQHCCDTPRAKKHVWWSEFLDYITKIITYNRVLGLIRGAPQVLDCLQEVRLDLKLSICICRLHQFSD